jgi:hypothetical protein
MLQFSLYAPALRRHGWGLRQTENPSNDGPRRPSRRPTAQLRDVVIIGGVQNEQKSRDVEGGGEDTTEYFVQ